MLRSAEEQRDLPSSFRIYRRIASIFNWMDFTFTSLILDITHCKGVITSFGKNFFIAAHIKINFQFLLFRTSLKSRLFNLNSKYLEIDFDYIALTMMVLVTMIASCGSRVGF